MRMRICTRNQSARIDLHPAIEILRALTELPRFELHLILILSRMCMILCQVAPVHLPSPQRHYRRTSHDYCSKVPRLAFTPVMSRDIDRALPEKNASVGNFDGAYRV
jgi:hypothetical protein